ncbi:fasciclin domain-containing protein [Luteolibacter luteus]|uniref:Fasciclin domain-containing protein n=1 Tax=Luteolibacter luteus TaxID=2728835 RepID=A0A858RL81_9BACT|nr:fasciclin domain-containing protein [Luteolibacter luteus]QJE97361.1 fasciclin domain-containing protein [Luteolibacter luteus]
MKILFIAAALIAVAPLSLVTSDAQQRSHEAPAKSGNVASVIAGQSDLTVFSTLIDAAGMRKQLSDGGPYTILAPTDDAFQLLGEGALEKLLMPENREKLLAMIRYHIIPVRMEASAIRTGEMKTLQGSKVAIDADSSAIWIGRAEIMRPDVRAGNGVIHAINMVLEPDVE